ncbi:MAG TPA: hypothetical protein VGF69_06185 [Thermoanaerobaculia bacterium]|jgi:hypothetical protein
MLAFLLGEADGDGDFRDVNLVSALSSILSRLSSLKAPLSSMLSRYRFESRALINLFPPFSLKAGLLSILSGLSF